MIGSTRNQLDRVAHFSIGLYAYPIAEWLLRKQQTKPWLAYSFARFSLMSLAAAYEIIEWWYAALAGGEEGSHFGLTGGYLGCSERYAVRYLRCNHRSLPTRVAASQRLRPHIAPSCFFYCAIACTGSDRTR